MQEQQKEVLAVAPAYGPLKLEDTYTASHRGRAARLANGAMCKGTQKTNKSLEFGRFGRNERFDQT